MTLDELVAVKVMGWTRCSDDCPAKDTCFFVDADGSVWLHGGIVPFHPSTRIVDAWAVVEKMKAIGYAIRIVLPSSGSNYKGWVAFSRTTGLVTDTTVVDGYAKIEGNAICEAITLAALRACGVTEGEIEAAQEKNHA